MQKHQIKTFDEYETPLYAIRDLLDHWQLENLHIYEPFIGSGHSTKCMRKLGHTVYAPGGDFFTHGVPDRSLYLITNPPFSIKKEILRKIFVEWNHPRVALLLPANVVQTDYFREITAHVELLKIMMPTARVKFIRDGKMMNKTAGFSCVWVCRGFGSNIHMEYLGHRGKKDP